MPRVYIDCKASIAKIELLLKMPQSGNSGSDWLKTLVSDINQTLGTDYRVDVLGTTLDYTSTNSARTIRMCFVLKN